MLVAFDQELIQYTELHCMGGFVLAEYYGLVRATGDVDVLESTGTDKATIARLGDRSEKISPCGSGLRSSKSFVVARDGHGTSSDSSGHSVLMSNTRRRRLLPSSKVLAGTQVAELTRTLEKSDSDSAKPFQPAGVSPLVASCRRDEPGSNSVPKHPTVSVTYRNSLRGLHTIGDYQDDSAGLRRLTIPTLVVNGAATVAFHRAINAALIRFLPHAEALELVGGHNSPAAVPEFFVAQWQRFQKRVITRDSRRP
jgi:pimeloyl-ACP methyl ester carboxylesterase